MTQLTQVKEILKDRKYTRRPKAKKKKTDITQGWTLSAGVWTNPKFDASVDDKSITLSGQYNARVMRGKIYHFAIQFKSLEQAIGWILYGKLRNERR